MKPPVRRRLAAENLETRRLLAAVIEQPAVDMAVYEQAMLERVNRARADPAAEAQRLRVDLNDGLDPGTISTEPKQPLAPMQVLADVAEAHSLDMIERQFFSHQNPDGEAPWTRARNAGYEGGGVGENIAAQSLLSLSNASWVLHENLYRSPGHRANFFAPSWRDIGIGMESGRIPYPSGGVFHSAIATQVFGGGTRNRFAITGVAYSDTERTDNFFTIGEQLPGVIVEATTSSGDTYRTTTGSSGGYALKLAPGSYDVTAYSPDRARRVAFGTVTLTDENVKLDVRNEQFVDVNPTGRDIILVGADETLSMSDERVNLEGVEHIDIRGSGDNVLMIDATRIPDGHPPLRVTADSGDRVEFDGGWQFDSAYLSDGQVVRRFAHDLAILDLTGPEDWVNPLDPYDVDALGGVSAVDALLIVNELGRRSSSSPADGTLTSPNSIADGSWSFYDVHPDGKVTALDALLVLNEMVRRKAAAASTAEGEATSENSVLPPPADHFRRRSDHREPSAGQSESLRMAPACSQRRVPTTVPSATTFAASRTTEATSTEGELEPKRSSVLDRIEPTILVGPDPAGPDAPRV